MAGERDTCEDQRYAREDHGGDVLAEDQDASTIATTGST
jgi:hypothetical protein